MQTVNVRAESNCKDYADVFHLTKNNSMQLFLFLIGLIH
jgi:hypothetical protein